MTAVPAPWHGEDDGGYESTRRDRRKARRLGQAQAREQRWQQHRLAVPYRTDGPKVTFGVVWFALLMGAVTTSALWVTVLVAVVAGLAGLQTGYAWFPNVTTTRWWTALAAFVGGLGGFLGPVGLATGVGLGVVVLAVYLIVNPPHQRTTFELFDVLIRSSLPVAIAGGSIAAMTDFGAGAAIALVALVSAYEVGDFLVGSGSSNAAEGPISGLVSLGVVLFILWIAAPAPFTSSSILLFGALVGVCCPLGQILASALLPRGNAWAPALRRMDSYLLSAPLWLFLLQSAPTTTTL